MKDTSPETEQMTRRLTMERSGVERMQMAARMFDAARAMVIHSLPRGLSDIELRSRLCERLYHAEVDIQGFCQALRRPH